MLSFWCRNCGKIIEIDDKYAGKKCKCPYCGNIMTVPTPQSVSRVEQSETIAAPTPKPSEPHPKSPPTTPITPEVKPAQSTKANTPTPSQPVAGDKETIEYKCAQCGKKLDGAGSMGGLEDKCPSCGNVHTVPMTPGHAREDSKIKMYILIRESVPTGFAMLAAAHASLACYLKFKDTPEIDRWLSGPFFKAVCRVNDQEFEQAREFDDHVVLTESTLDNQEVALAFKPREEWPKPFKSYRLYK